MNEQKIKLPEIDPEIFGTTSRLRRLLENWCKSFGCALPYEDRENLNSHLKAMMNAHALEAVLMNQQAQEQAQATTERRPFDLEAAKRGEPLVTRDGRSAKFVAYVPGALEKVRVIAMIEELEVPTFYNEHGDHFQESRTHLNLLMAPKPKRTVWVNFHGSGVAIYYQSESEAKESALQMSPIAIAVPVHIDE